MIGYLNNPFENYRKSSILGATNSSMGPAPRTSPTYPIGEMSGLTNTRQADPTQRGFGPQRGYDDDIMSLMKPSPGLEAYKQYLTTMPNRQDYTPGAGTRIASALSGFAAGVKDPAAGIKVAQDLNSSKYRAAMEDYANRGYGLKETSDIEQQDRDNQIKTLQQARAMGLDYDKLALENRKFDVTTGQKGQEIDIARRRADAYIKNLGQAEYGPAEQLADGTLLYTNKHDPSDTRRIDPRQFGGSGTVKAGELGVSQYNAVSSRIGAGAQASNAATNAGRFGWEQTRGAEPPNAGDMGKGYSLALDILSNDRHFGKYIIRDKPSGQLVVNPDMQDDPGYDTFLDALSETSRAGVEGNLFARPAPPSTYIPQPRRTGGR